MAPAYRNTPKGVIITKTGTRLNYGQMFPAKEGKPMFKNPQRPLNTHVKNLAREGAEKRSHEAAPVHGQRSRTAPGAHPYLHGAPISDEANMPIKSHERAIQVNPGMSAKTRAKADPQAASKLLADAATLGRKA